MSKKKPADAIRPTVLAGGNLSTDAIRELGRIRHIASGVSFNVSPDNPDCIDQMTLALETLLDVNPPLENEAVREYFRQIVNHYSARDAEKVENVVYPKSIADFFAAVLNKGDHVELEYSETAGRGTLGKFFWSLSRWARPSVLNWFQERKGDRGGLLYSLLMKLRILPSIETNLILEIRDLLNSGVAGQIFGEPTSYRPSEWIIDSAVLGRDILIRPALPGEVNMALADQPVRQQDRDFATKVEEFLLRDIRDTGFGTVDGLRKAMIHRFGWRNVPTRRLHAVLPRLIQRNKLALVTTNTRMKKQLKILAKGYPKVIVPQDRVAQLHGD